jgi:hypothetical protein
MKAGTRNIRFSVLLLLTVMMIIAIPFLRDFARVKLLLDIFTAVILIAAIWATGQRKNKIVVFCVFALPWLILTWINHLVDNSLLLFGSNTLGAFLFGLAVYSILKYVTNAEEVTREVIFAAIVSYLLLAVIWSFGYSSLELVSPGSFSISAARAEDSAFNFLYFSFVTITTLGYGDITPLTDQASALVIVEALIGQIYLVVLVAWLVGMHVSRKSR